MNYQIEANRHSKLTPKQVARELVLQALSGRMQDWDDRDITFYDPEMSDKRREAIREQISKYVDRCYRLVDGK